MAAIERTGRSKIYLLIGALMIGCAPPTAQPPLEPHDAFHPGEHGAETVLDSVLSSPTRHLFGREGSLVVARTGIMEARVDEDHCELAVRHAGRRTTIRLATRGASTEVNIAGGDAVRSVGTLVEHVSLHADGLQQSWHASEPRSEFNVRVEVSGARFIARTDAGLHFRADDDSLGFRYSNGILIDSSGAHFDVPAEWTGSAIELRVPPHVLTGARFPVVLDPVISPEQELESPLVVPHRTSSVTGIGFDGTQNWVLYNDRGRPSHSLRATRVDATGTVLDPYGIILHEGTPTASGGLGIGTGQVLVAWGEQAALPEIRAARISRSGAVLDSPITLATGAPTAFRVDDGPEVASDGVDFLVVWRTSGTLRASRVSGSGVLLDAMPFSVNPVADTAYNVDVAFANGRYVVVYYSGDEIRGVRVAPSGAVLDASPVVLHRAPTGTSLTFPRVESSGSGIVMAWTRGRLEGSGVTSTGFVAARLDDAGGLGLGPIVTLGASPATLDKREPSIGTDGTRTLITWSSGSGLARDVQGVRLSADGTLLDASPIAIATGPDAAAGSYATTTTSGFLVGWTEQTLRLARAQRFTDAGTAIDPAPFSVALSSNKQTGPLCEFGGRGYLVAWTDTRALATHLSDVYAARVAEDGTVLDSTAVSVAAGVDNERVTDVAWDGANYWVTYVRTHEITEGDVFTRRVAPDGTLPDAAPFNLVTEVESQEEPHVSSDGTNLLVAWLDRRGVSGGSGGRQLRARFFTPTGSAVGPEMILYGEYRVAGIHSVFAAGIHYVGFRYNVPASTARASAIIRVRPDGTILDAVPVDVGEREWPILVPDSAGILALTHTVRPSYARLYTSRVDGVSAPSSSMLLRSVVRDQVRWLAGIFDGTDYLGIGIQPASSPPNATRVFGIPLDATGAEAGAEFDVFITPPQGVSVTGDLCSAGRGSSLFTYSRLESPGPYGTRRVYVRNLGGDPAALGARCGSDGSCLSGFCVDGVCCDAECGGGDADDCQACSVVAGARVDGACSPLGTGSVCRVSRGQCDAEEQCDGASNACPADLFVPDATPCDDSVTCNGAETCVAGACTLAAALECDDSEPCTTDACIEPAGCMSTPIAGCGSGLDAGVMPGIDAGTSPGIDAGTDAGSTSEDAGAEDAGLPSEREPDCGCRVGADAPTRWPLLLLFASITMARTRRRTRAWRP